MIPIWCRDGQDNPLPRCRANQLRVYDYYPARSASSRRKTVPPVTPTRCYYVGTWHIHTCHRHRVVNDRACKCSLDRAVAASGGMLPKAPLTGQFLRSNSARVPDQGPIFCLYLGERCTKLTPGRTHTHTHTQSATLGLELPPRHAKHAHSAPATSHPSSSSPPPQSPSPDSRPAH